MRLTAPLKDVKELKKEDVATQEALASAKEERDRANTAPDCELPRSNSNRKM
jgi:hypothetical protein